MTPENSRRDEILQHLAHMLEATPGGRITTAALAAQVGVSEAALYRHFPSKAKMFEALIAFIEDTLFTRITRLLTGDALAGENERLRARMLQFFDRLETELRTVLREAEPREGLRTVIPAAQAANLLLAAAEGRIAQFVRSDFRRNPSEQWAEQWRLLAAATFRRPEAP